MHTISSTDRIFATVINHGDTIYNSLIVGASSLEDLVCRITGALRGKIAGMVTLVIRNSSQGWLQKHALRIGGIVSTPTPEAVQLSLF